jgi:uncharacterized linocin/CFP29 family protein
MDHSATLPWTEEQWAMLNRLVQDTARNTRVAGSFLPLEGPLPPDQAFVPAMVLQYRPNAQILYPVGGDDRRLLAVQGRAAQRVEIDGAAVLSLVRTFCSIDITTAQAQDPELAAVKQLVIRAADVLGRLEDEIIFNGMTHEWEPSGVRGRLFGGTQALETSPAIYVVSAPVPGADYQGMLTSGGAPRRIGPVLNDETLINAIVEAIEAIEVRGYSGPFACVLGTRLFLSAVTPAIGLILPSDRIIPLLKGGPLLRSTSVGANVGLLVGLGGAPIDLVIGSDLELKYLGRNENVFLLSVSERFRLRIKDNYPGPPASSGPIEPIQWVP